MIFLCVHSMEEEKDSIMGTESDSDTVEKKDGTSCEVKWTEEEVSKIFLTSTPFMKKQAVLSHTLTHKPFILVFIQLIILLSLHLWGDEHIVLCILE